MRKMGIITGVLNKVPRGGLVGIVWKLPVSHVKLQRFCPRALLKSETWQGNREESAGPLPRRASTVFVLRGISNSIAHTVILHG